MTLFLFLQALLEALAQLIEIERFESGELLRGELPGQHWVGEPFEKLVGDVEMLIDAAEVFGESPIVEIVLGLALDQQRPRQMVEDRQIGAAVAFRQSAHQW